MVVDEIPNGTNVVFKLFGEGQSFSHQSRNSLPEGIIEALYVISLSRFFTHLMQFVVVEDGSVSFPVVGIGRCFKIAIG